MGERYLIDTSAVIKYLNKTLPIDAILFIDKIVDEESIISVISRIELLSWDPKDPEDLSIYVDFVRFSNVFDLTELIIVKTIKIRKEKRLKIPDAIIAATAIVNNLTLIADNDKDFLKVDGLKYLNPNSIVNSCEIDPPNPV